MAKPSKLKHPKQLLVEGRDAEALFYPFLESMEVTDIEIHNYGSITELAGFLKQFIRNADFRQLPVTSIGIVRDAEDNAESAFQSICSALKNANLPVPSQNIQGVDVQNLKVSTFVLPDGKRPGMLETLILKAVEDKSDLSCVEQYLQCVKQSTGVGPKVMDKARFLAFLAAQQEYKPVTGHAARAGYLNFASSIYDPLKAFIRAL